jgi:UDP-N-acetylmuramate dehydrogenase
MENPPLDHIKQFQIAFPDALENEPLSRHTYLKIGGPARLYLVASTVEMVVEAMTKARELGIASYVLGGGSNVLVSDEGFAGLVIQCADRRTTIEGDRVIAATGAFSGLVAKLAADASLAGFEWGIGVPGTIGGAIYGNAGCFGGDMKDVVFTVEAYQIAEQKMVTYTNAECDFQYRDSRFKHEPHIILRTTLQLHPGDQAEIRARMEAIMQGRKTTQPQGAFTAGCLFKNFEYTDEAVLEKLAAQYEIPAAMREAKRIPAGWLVDQLGLKGFTIGKAQVSPVHGNFLVNLGGARAEDVIALESYVKMKVRDELGILLEDEVQLLGF